jgi:ubiquinone/menaquinone biosynthesis C-methylase UbiE
MESVDEHLLGAYDRAAPSYDVGGGITVFAPFGERLAELVRLQPGERVLDVACGAGAALLPAAAHVGPGGEAVGIDLSPRMVERARLAIARAELPHARAEVMDAAVPSFPDASFDVVLCGFGLSALADPDGAVAQWRRVLGQQGRIGVSAWENLVDERWRWESELTNLLAREVPAELLETVGARSRRYEDEEKLRGELEAAGFADVSIERKEVECTYASAEAWWEWVWSHGFRAFVEALPEPARERFRAAAFAHLAGSGRRARSRHFIGLLATARVGG